MKKLLLVLTSLLLLFGCTSNNKLSFENFKKGIEDADIKDVSITINVDKIGDFNIARTITYFDIEKWKNKAGSIYNTEGLDQKTKDDLLRATTVFYNDGYAKMKELLNDISITKIDTPKDMPYDLLYRFGYGHLGDNLNYFSIFNENIIEISNENNKIYYTISNTDMEKIHKYFEDIYEDYIVIKRK